MTVELSPEELETLIQALGYAHGHARDAREVPAEVRAARLARIEATAAKLRAARRGPPGR